MNTRSSGIASVLLDDNHRRFGCLSDDFPGFDELRGGEGLFDQIDERPVGSRWEDDVGAVGCTIWGVGVVHGSPHSSGRRQTGCYLDCCRNSLARKTSDSMMATRCSLAFS